MLGAVAVDRPPHQIPGSGQIVKVMDDAINKQDSFQQGLLRLLSLLHGELHSCLPRPGNLFVLMSTPFLISPFSTFTIAGAAGSPYPPINSPASG